MRTLAHTHCAARGLAADAFAPLVLRATLHAPARLLYRPIRFLFPQFFAADFDLVNAAGWLTRVKDLDLDLRHYRDHPCNQSRLRRALCPCLSTRRLRRIVSTTLASA